MIRIVLRMLVCAVITGCEASAFVDCEEGTALSACMDDDTLYCIDMRPQSNDCRLVAEVGADSIWCCPADD